MTRLCLIPVALVQSAFGPFMCGNGDVETARQKLRSGEPDLALAALASVEDDQPEVHLARGLTMLAKGDHEKAVASLDQGYRVVAEAATEVPEEDTVEAARLEDLRGRILFARGLAHAAAETWEAAFADFSKVLAIDPTDQDARWNLEIAWFRLHPPCPQRDDDHEEDDSPEKAQPFAPEQAQGRLLCPSDADWYRLDEVPAGAMLYVTVTGKLEPKEEGDTREAALKLHAPNAATPVREAALLASSSKKGELTATVGVAGVGEKGTWLFGLSGPGRAEVSYGITVEVVPPCPADDALEQNDSQDTASAVTDGEQAGLKACPGDADWYRITVPAGEARQVTLKYLPTRGALELLRFDPETGESTPQAAEAITIAKNDAEQIAWVQVRTLTGAENTYTLAVGPPEEGEDGQKDEKDEKDEKDQQDEKDEQDEQDEKDQGKPPEPDEIDVDQLIDGLDEHEGNPQLEKVLRRLRTYPRLEDY